MMAGSGMGGMDFECLTCFATFDSPTKVVAHSRQQHQSETMPEMEQTSESRREPQFPDMMDSADTGVTITDYYNAVSARPISRPDVCSSTPLVNADADVDAYADVEIDDSSLVNGNGSKQVIKCPDCSAFFKSPSQLDRHTAVHSTDKPFTCDICSASFKRPQELPQHMIYNHMNNSQFKCKHCDLTFPSTKLKSHSLTHITEKPFKCDQCDSTFKRAEYLRQHGLVHSTDFPFQCSDCDAKFKRANQLKLHVSNHVKVTGAFKCKVCFDPFDSKIEMQVHEDTAHALQFKCDSCPMSYKTARSLTKHEIESHNTSKQTKRTVSSNASSAMSTDEVLAIVDLAETNNICDTEAIGCELCSKTFQSMGAKEYHQKIHKLEACENCGKV
ncbi:hypothetical protein HK100_007073, partial [Physocladia obscura]